MAGFGEDVSMADFRPTQQDEDPDAGVGHTSDDSVLNVQIAAAVPPRTEQSVAVAAAGGEFRTSLPSGRRDKVRQSSSFYIKISFLGVCVMEYESIRCFRAL